MVIPLIAILSVPPLSWFGHHPWKLIGYDASRYLFAGSELVSGGGFDSLAGISNYNGGHGPVLPALIGSLILILGRDTESLVWAVRLLALLNPLLAYFLAKRLSNPLAGLIAAALLSLFGYNVKSAFLLNIDGVLLTFYLLGLLSLLAAIKRGTSSALAFLSGVLLGISILTKETAFANLPLALLAVLLLNWELRAAIWHYVGLALVCLPWWVWRWSETGEVYLIDRLPPPLQLPTLLVSAVLLVLAIAAYAYGIVDSFVAAERWRRWVGRFVVVGWSASLTVLVLATSSHKLAKASLGSVGDYLTGLLAPATIVVPVVLLAGGYVVWKALRRGEGGWRVLALALLFQIPVCVLVAVQEWAPRQFLVAQTLVICALGALVVDAGKAASWRASGAYPLRVGGAVVALALGLFLVVSSVQRVQALLPEDPLEGFYRQHRVAPQASGMVDWMEENVPEGEHILVNVAQGQYLAYLDGGRHEWTFLRLDQEICKSRPNIQTRCDPAENSISRIPSDALWVQTMMGRCRVISLSMPNLLEQVRQSSSDYLLITGSGVSPSILRVPSLLQESGAFEVVHAEGRSGVQGVVLLKSTGLAPEAVPTLINRNTLVNLKRCEGVKGEGDSSWLRSTFPYGVLEVRVSD